MDLFCIKRAVDVSSLIIVFKHIANMPHKTRYLLDLISYAISVMDCHVIENIFDFYDSLTTITEVMIIYD